MREVPYYIGIMSIEDLKKAVAGKLDRLADQAIDDLRKGRARANNATDPFAVFSEWSSQADEKAYRDL